MNFAYGWAFSKTRPQGLLQHHHHRVVRGRCLLIGSIELDSILTGMLRITTGPLAVIARLDLNYVGYGIVGSRRHLADRLRVWKYGRIEEKWTARLDTDQ